MFFDSHAHLDDQKFDADRDAVIQRAKENNISYILNPGADFASSVKAIDLAAKYEMVYAAVGVHPHEAKTMDEVMLALLRGLTTKPKVKLIGEDGNAFVILGRTVRAMRKAGWSSEDIEKFQNEAMSGDYNHLLMSVMKYCDVY